LVLQPSIRSRQPYGKMGTYNKKNQQQKIGVREEFDLSRGDESQSMKDTRRQLADLIGGVGELNPE